MRHDAVVTFVPMKKLTPDEKLTIYFQAQQNRWYTDVAQDCKGRALLPLDEVFFPWASDEGAMLMIYGTVLGSEWEHGGVMQGLVPVRVHRYFCETFMLMPVLMLPPNALMLTPKDMWLHNFMGQKITDSNIVTILQAGGRLHINKVPIVVS